MVVLKIPSQGARPYTPDQLLKGIEKNFNLVDQPIASMRQRPRHESGDGGGEVVVVMVMMILIVK